MEIQTEEEKAIYADYLGIFIRGIQWSYAEEHDDNIGERKALEIWEDFGEYQDECAKIFNERYPEWHVIRRAYDNFGDGNNEYIWDYFGEEPIEVDEFTIDIEKRPVIDGTKQIMVWFQGDQYRCSSLNHNSADIKFHGEVQAAIHLNDFDPITKYLISRGWQVFDGENKLISFERLVKV